MNLMEMLKLFQELPSWSRYGGSASLLISFLFFGVGLIFRNPIQEKFQNEVVDNSPTISIGSNVNNGNQIIGVGDINILEEKAPEVHFRVLSSDKLSDGSYRSIGLIVVTKIVANLYLEARGEGIDSFEVGPRRIGAFVMGHSGKRGDSYFTNIPNAQGEYTSTVISKNNKVEIIYDFE